MNWSDYCGSTTDPAGFSFTALVDGNLSPCLHLLLQGGISAVFFFVNICYFFNFVGYRQNTVRAGSQIGRLTLVRCLLSITLGCFLTSIYAVHGLDITKNSDLGEVLFYLIMMMDGVSWLIFGAMSFCLRYVFPRYRRMPGVVCLILLCNMTLFATAFYSNSPNIQSFYLNEITTVTILYIAASVIYVLLILILIPSGDGSLSVDIGDERDSLLGSSSATYQTFGSRRVLLVGECGNLVSRLFFWWVQPLMAKGKQKQIETADDVFTVSCACS